MDAKTLGDHQKLLTDVIKKQIVILGPDITLAKARNVQGLTVADDGTVTAITGDPQVLTQKLVDQFMELSGLIVKKTMEPLLANTTDATATQPNPVAPVPPAQPETPPAPAAQPTQQTPPAAAPQAPKEATPSSPNPPLANSNSDMQQSEKTS